MPLPNIPLVNLTGAPNLTQPASTLATAGQFANLIQKNAPKPKPNFINANGSSVTPPSTSQIGGTGAFGAMLPKVNTGVPQINTGVQQIGVPRQTRNVPRFDTELATTYSGSLASLTGANNARGVNQQNPLIYGPPTPVGYRGQIVQAGAKTQAELIRRNQINQLTTPYGTAIPNATSATGSYNPVLASLTGANMVEPTQTGFPGTDYRQPVKISNAALGLPTNNVVTQTYTGRNKRKSSYGGYVGGGGSNGYGYNYPTSSPVGQVLNWRVATG